MRNDRLPEGLVTYDFDGPRYADRNGYGDYVFVDDVEALVAENKELRSALRHIRNVLGPTSPTCQGCSAEIEEALETINEVLK